MAFKFGKDGQNVVGQMQESITEIENNKDIPAESKAQMLEQMKQSVAEMENSFKAPQEDQDTVKPYVAELDKIFDWQE